MLHPRVRTALLLPLPTVAIGIASSLILIVMMKIASVLQSLFWQRLSGTLGIAQGPLLWIIGALTLVGIAVGLVIRFSQDHTGSDPVCKPLVDVPVPPSAPLGLIVALILGLADDASLGSEHPIIAVDVALTVTIGVRLLPRVSRMKWIILTSAGTIGMLSSTPIAAALTLSQTLNSSSRVPLWDRLFTPLMVVAAGALTTGLFFHPHFSLSIAHHGQMGMTDILSGVTAAAIVIVARVVAVWCLPRLHAMMNRMRNPMLVLGVDGFILDILGVIGGPVSSSKRLDEMQRMVANQAFSTSGYFLLAAIELVVPIVAATSGSYGGRISSAMFIGVALGLMLHEYVPAISAAITVSRAIPDIVLVVTRDGWLSLFMAAVIIPNTTLLSLLCIIMLPAWLLLAGKSMTMVNRPKRQPPHDNVQQKILSSMI